MSRGWYEDGAGIRRGMRHVATGMAASAVLLAAAGTVAGAGAQETHLVLVTGLGGDPGYAETFHDWAATLRRGALEAGVRPERIAWLADEPQRAPDAVTAAATRESLVGHLEQLAGAAASGDRVMLVLIGHGTARNDEARFNLRGPDITGAELADVLEAFAEQTVAVVNTAPSSGPWAQALAAPNRIVVTATKTARERNETQFGRFFARAYRGGEADLDKDGRVSLLEAYRYATDEVARYYDEEGLLLTEHALLEDGGDLAARFWLTPRLGAAADAPEADVPADVTDPELRQLHLRRAELERQVADLRDRRESMEEEAYEARLEELLVELALVSRRIREAGGGGS